MAAYELIRTVHGPDGQVEVHKKRPGLIACEGYYVQNVRTKRYASLRDFDDAMREAYRLAGRDPSTYRVGD